MKKRNVKPTISDFFQISSELLLTSRNKKSQMLGYNSKLFRRVKAIQKLPEFPRFYLAVAILDFTTSENIPLDFLMTMTTNDNEFKNWSLTIFLSTESKK